MKPPLLRLRSLRGKILACVLAASIAALLVTGVSLLAYDQREYRNTVAHGLAVEAELIAHSSVAALQFDDPGSAAASLAVLDARPTIRAAAIYNARGKVFASYLRPGVPREEIPGLPAAEGVSIEDGRIAQFHRVIRDKEIAGTVYLSADFESGRRLADYAAITLAVALGALVVSVALSYWLQRGITRPIAEVSDLARRIVEQRDYSVRARATTSDEIGTLVRAFNAMLDEIERRTGALTESESRYRTLAADLEGRVRDRTAELEETNRQLEAFSYSVSHDLRAPLRAIDGFGQALMDDYGDEASEGSRRYLARIRSATLRMSQLIDDLLNLAKVSRAEVSWKDVDLAAIARQVAADLAQREPERQVEVAIWDDVTARGDPRLLRIVLENLLGNAWKFTAKSSPARIEVGVLHDAEAATYFVRDNGAGFDMAHATQLFNAFQRLHAVTEYPGTGIGLATVHRIVAKHRGRIWAHAQPGKGATFYFTLGVPAAAAPPVEAGRHAA